MRSVATNDIAVVAHVFSLTAASTVLVISLDLHDNHVRLSNLILLGFESLKHILNTSFGAAYTARVHLWIDPDRLDALFDNWIVGQIEVQNDF